MLKMDIFGKKM